MNEVLHSLRHVSVEEILLPLLLQLAVIILAARAFAVVFRRLGQPAVVGEVVAGLVLGPSVLGRLSPQVEAFLFQPTVTGLAPELGQVTLGWIIATLSQLGLVFLLFLIGLEFDFSHLRGHSPAAVGIAVAGIALPFAFGLGVAEVLWPFLERPVPPLGFSLFLGTALSITAIPVLGRIMLELNITRTRLGTITISAAAVDDACGWILLATIAAVTRADLGQGSFDIMQTVVMAGETVAFALVMLLLVRPLVCRWARHVMRVNEGEVSVNALAVLLTLMLVCSIVTNLIGIFAVFGAFVLGAVLSGEREFSAAVIRRVRDLVTVFFLPIFFTCSGLRTNLNSLDSTALWLLCGLVTVAAVAGKLGGCAVAARLVGIAPRETACIGVMMNTRGLMALIVINLGKDLGVIPDSVFCMLVLMALATTLMTTPLLLHLMRGTELEPYIRDSAFMGNVKQATPSATGVHP